MCLNTIPEQTCFSDLYFSSSKRYFHNNNNKMQGILVDFIISEFLLTEPLYGSYCQNCGYSLNHRYSKHNVDGMNDDNLVIISVQWRKSHQNQTCSQKPWRGTQITESKSVLNSTLKAFRVFHQEYTSGFVQFQEMPDVARNPTRMNPLLKRNTSYTNSEVCLSLEDAIYLK